MTKLLVDELALWVQYIHSICGIRLDGSKAYLIESRLQPLLESTGSRNFSELYYRTKTEKERILQRKVIDAITTGETSFFRDSSLFELLQYKIFPELLDKKKEKIRIWSAACSTGQEVYSVTMVLADMLGNQINKYNIQILGTDISDQAIARASRGVFSKVEVERGLPSEKLNKYFAPADGGWTVSPGLRSLASFSKFNLMDSFSSLGRFDLVLCRNVAIYFSEEDKIRVFEKVASVMELGGVLAIGSTESLSGICPQFELKNHLRSNYYELKK